jgi:hypothetical protein
VTPEALREGVRSALGNAIASDADRRGGRTGLRLVLSGMLGVAGALAVTWLVAAHPMGHHPSWHLGFFSTSWAGLLVVVLALGLLDVRTPRWPIAQAARTGVLALVIAGLCAYACPDQHFLRWWDGTQLGGWLTRETGATCSAFCLGLIASAAFAFLAALPTLPRKPPALRCAALTAAIIALLLAPGVALQTTDAAPALFAAWLGGIALGSLAGVIASIGLRTRAATEGPAIP